MNDFKSLGLSSKVLNSIESMGYEVPSPIQSEIIPLIIEGHDVIGQAQTGTGKTLAFAASILSKIDVAKNVVQCIVLTPTRELAIQVCDEFNNLNKSDKFDILAVYGGDSIERQIKALNKGVDVVVGTPGRVLDLIKRKKLSIKDINFFVLDEADEMLNMGFLEDIESVLKATNVEKQILMFSATMPVAIKKLARNYMSENHKIVEVKKDTETSNNVTQHYCIVNEKHRLEILCRLLDYKESLKTIIFCHTKKECDELVTELQQRGYSVEAMHGDISQNMRLQTLERFKKGSFNFLIATDVAARGIHVNNVELVINIKLPRERENYVHRIGRTGRANSKGEAITLITHKDMRRLSELERFTKSKLIEMPIPKYSDIIDNKYETIIRKSTEVEGIEKALEYVRDLSKGELINIAASLIKMNVADSMGAYHEDDIIVKDKNRNTKVDKNKTRVFVTIGKKDGLKKGSLLDFLKKETGINTDNFNNIEILNTYTFIDLNNDIVDKFMKSLKRKRFNGRDVRVEVSKKSKRK